MLGVGISISIAFMAAALAIEHRTTLLESRYEQTQKQLDFLIKTQEIHGQTLMRVTTILDQMIKRNDLENQRQAHK